MKLKFQQGGTFVPPYAVFQPFIIPTQNNVSNSKTSSNKDDGNKMEKYYKLLDKLKGLPGDISAVSSKLVSLFDNIEYKLNSDGLFGDTSSVSSEYMMITNLISNIQTQYDAYQKAVDTAISKGSLNEVVIDSMGKIMVQSEEGFDWITPEEYFNNKDSYLPVTNSKLLEYRKDGIGGLAFNSESILAVTSGIGIAEVTKIIQDAIQDLGNTSNVNTNYIGVKSGDLLKGIQDYSIALQQSGKYDSTVQDLYKVKLLTEDQAKQAKLALQFIYNTLPESAKTLLKMKSNGTNSGVEVLIGTLINSKLTNKSEFIPDLVGGPSKEKSGKTGSEGTANDKSNPYLQLIREEGGQPRTFTIVSEDTNNGLQITGTFYSALPNVNEEMSIDALLATGMLNITGNSRKSISFGDQLLDTSQLKDVMFDNEGGVVMTLPTITDQLGNVRVNMAIVEDFNKVQNELKKYKNLPEHEYNKKYAELLKKYELDELIDSTTGLPDLSRTAQFLVIGAYTTDKIDINKKSKFIKKVKNPTEDLEKRLIKGLSTNEDRNDYVIDVDNHWGFIEGFWDDIYRANVFIPLNQNPNAAVNAKGDQRSETSVTAAEQMYQSFNKYKNMKPTYEVE